jgi:hypothetical protein
MIRSAKLKLLIAVAASLLWPVWAPGESRVASDQPSTSQPEVATARVLFKIIIPQELSMEIAEAERAGEQGMIIGGNDRKRTPVSIMGTDAEPTRVMLSTVGRRSIARLATCVRTASAQSVPRLSCTVSMP